VLQDVTRQAPFAHAADPFVAAQTTLHAPQLRMSEVVLTSHPFEGLPSQSANPALHWLSLHAPLMQAAVPFGRVPQAFGARLSTWPSQLLSMPSQTSVLGVTCPLHGPNAVPLGSQVVVPT
jgi:hypothetical protein